MTVIAVAAMDRDAPGAGTTSSGPRGDLNRNGHSEPTSGTPDRSDAVGLGERRETPVSTAPLFGLVAQDRLQSLPRRSDAATARQAGAGGGAATKAAA
ncbi:hypothetical protein AB0L56_09630 [Streptomyces sp. NPDC052079]|uniref:hypothetical protein n=1 Tax=Streptomyces sp. NPDC052079 TaxID=3155526 RepID=UPI003448DEF2